MRCVNTNQARPASTKQKGGNPSYYKPEQTTDIRKYFGKDGKVHAKRARLWQFKGTISRQVIKTLENKVFNAMVVIECNSKTGEVRHIGQEVIKEFNEDQCVYEEHRTGRRFNVIKLFNDVWTELEIAISESAKSLGQQIDGDTSDGVLVDKAEVFF